VNSNFIQIPLEKDEVMQALKKAIQSNFIDNLRDRHPNVMLDSKLRGYVGEIAFKKWLKQNGIAIEESNVFDEKSGIDIDFVYKGLHIELKTSLLPDADQCLEKAIERRDIKLIKRQGNTIEELNGDVHVQMIFNQLRMRKDEWLEKQRIDLKAELEEIYNRIAAYRYERDCCFVGWIDKQSLIKQIQNKVAPLQKWKYGMREFWCCNLEKDAKRPEELVKFLKY
jgi:hypothetical protein